MSRCSIAPFIPWRRMEGSKSLFLKNWDHLKRDGRVQLEEILDLNARLNTLYWLKDLLAHIWDYYYPGWAMKMLAEWCEVASMTAL